MADMTKRDFLNAVIEAEVSENITDFAVAEIEKMDAVNEKRREKAQEKAAANMENFNKFLSVLTDEPMTATQLVEALDGVIVRDGDKALTPQYIARLAKTGVDNGSIAKVSVKVEGAKGAKVGYKLA